ncbi:hypothetical protein HA402_004969 [Bradysia odoriphaga]|nr:hypothetical protein HA402_004969 [Bradysia odoriphaga]
MSTKKSLPTKLKPVTKENEKNEKNEQVKILESRQLQELVKKSAREISNEVVSNTVRKAVMSTEFTKDLLNVTVRKAVQSAELLKKYPPLPDNIRKLAEPTTATYIALYNKHRNILRPKAVGSVKMKISDYLQKIEELSLQNQLDKASQIDSRKKRKTEARKAQKEKEFAIFCDEKCDEIFNLFLKKFTETFNADREIPKPLILGSSSLNLYQSIQGQITKLITTKKTAETAQASASIKPTVRLLMNAGKTSVEPTVKRLMSAGGNSKETLDPKKSTNVTNSEKTTETLTGTGDASDAESTKENAETKEIVDKLSYFIMEFVQNSLVEAVDSKDEQLIPPEQVPHEQTLFGSVKPFYYQYNNVLKSAVHYKGKFLITIPRRGSGVPSTLNYIPDDLPVGSSPSLRPYPDFETNELHPELKPDENRIVSVYRTRVDVCDRLWFVDTGTLQGHEGGKKYNKNCSIKLQPNMKSHYFSDYNKLIQRPSLWLIDLKTDKRIRRFEIPESIVMEGHGMISIRVDVEKDKCDDAYAYISDYLKEKIYVYSYKTNRMWPVSHVYMNDEKKFGIYKVDGVEFEWFDGIFSVALGRKSPSTGYRTAYFHPLSRYRKTIDIVNFIQKKIGNRGKSGHSMMHEFDDRTSVIFFAMLTRNAITCWNSNTKYLAENQGTIIENDNRFKYPVDLNIDTNGTLWALTNNFVRFSYGKLDTNEYNYRLWRGNPKQLVKDTVCEPRKFKPVDKVTDGGPR